MFMLRIYLRTLSATIYSDQDKCAGRVSMGMVPHARFTWLSRSGYRTTQQGAGDTSMELFRYNSSLTVTHILKYITPVYREQFIVCLQSYEQMSTNEFCYIY